MKTGIEAFSVERIKQITKHGFTGKHHANHPEWYDQGQLVDAARILTDKNDIGQYPVNWDRKWFSDLRSRKYEERLVIAGSLLAAEYDRLMYLELISEIEKWESQVESLGGPDAPGASVKHRLIKIEELKKKLEYL